MSREPKTIEEYLADLRKINQELQREDVHMDDAIKLYERGAALAVKAQALLNEYEHQIDEIEAEALAAGNGRSAVSN